MNIEKVHIVEFHTYILEYMAMGTYIYKRYILPPLLLMIYIILVI